jgi:hypothetical protein
MQLAFAVKGKSQMGKKPDNEKLSFNETPQFLASQKEWYARLEREGFEDIEKGETDTVIRPQIIKTEKSQYEGGHDYYELCQTILREYRFKKEMHRMIFEMHTEGRSERVIVKHMWDKYGHKISQQGVNVLIKRTKENYLKDNK